jgi:hypothetical protein
MVIYASSYTYRQFLWRQTNASRIDHANVVQHTSFMPRVIVSSLDPGGMLCVVVLPEIPEADGLTEWGVLILDPSVAKRSSVNALE